MVDIDESITEIDSILSSRINEFIDQLKAQAKTNEVDSKLNELTLNIQSMSNDPEKLNEAKKSIAKLEAMIEKVKSKHSLEILQKEGGNYLLKLD